MGDVFKVASLIVGLGLVATVVVNGANSAKVIGAATGGFAQDIGAAERG
jgi:hypothetical protein